MSIRKALGLLLAITAASGCVSTPYKAYGFRGGYEDRPLGKDKFWIKFTGNGFTEQEAVKVYWKRRASELCNGREYRSKSFLGTEGRGGAIVMGTGAYYGETTRFPVMEGTVECQNDESSSEENNSDVAPE